jgi:homoserine kinase
LAVTLPVADIAVPGSISNVGPAFDTLSVALQLYVRVTVLDVCPSAPDSLEFHFADGPLVGDNRIERAFRLARARYGVPAPGLRVEVRSTIPRCAGLGSSGAATIAGFRLYEAVTSAHSGEDWLSLACELEGHPDNAAAALIGGMTLSCQREDGRVLLRGWRWPDDIHIVIATPGVPLETAVARRVLPATVTLADAVFNLQRALLLVRAIETGRHEDLREALRDRWHQPYRTPLVPGLKEALALEHPSLLGTCLSGAGPSVVAFATGGAADVTALLEATYARLRVPCTVRLVAVHQPEEAVGA